MYKAGRCFDGTVQTHRPLSNIPASTQSPLPPPHHVVQGARPGHQELRIRVDGQPEVRELDDACAGHDDVLRLDVAVCNALMSGMDPSRERYGRGIQLLGDEVSPVHYHTYSMHCLNGCRYLAGLYLGVQVL